MANYNTRNLKEQVEEADNFKKISKYINTVLDNFSDISKIDKNDLYELFYINKVLDNSMNSGVTNIDIKRNMQDIKERVQLVIASFTDANVEEILERPEKSRALESVNKVKYGEKEKYKGLEDVNHKETKFKNPIVEYFRRRGLPRIIALLMFGAVIFMPTEYINNASAKISSALMGDPKIETELDTSETSIEEILVNNEYKPDPEKAEMLNNFSKETSEALGVILKLIATMGTAMVSLTLLLDITKVVLGGFPALEAALGDKAKGFFSEDAYFVSDIENLAVITNKSINTNNRLEVAKTLLTNLISEYPNYTMDVEEFNYLVDANKIKERIETSKGKELISACVDAECLVDKVHKRQEEFYKSLTSYTYSYTSKSQKVSDDENKGIVSKKGLPNY